MKKTLCIILAVLVLAVSLCACGNGSSIEGSWTGSAEGISVTFKFEKDGNGTLSALGGLASESFTYTIADGKITITDGDGDADVFDYSIDGDTLTLTAEDEVLTLTRDK